MLPDPGANSFLTPSQISDSLFRAGAHLHLSGYTLLNPATRTVGQIALARARAGNLTCSLDTASAAPISANPGAIREALGQIDVLLANTDEAAALTGFTDPAQALVALAEVVDTVVIKCGPQGALAAQGNQHVKVPALPAKVVDTTGAGDAFAAGFLVSWRAGAPLVEAVTAGVREATQAISRVGAGPEGR
jgi:sugar/nucleoside kinase (ribokinase family)